jgi:hypothetical protein
VEIVVWVFCFVVMNTKTQSLLSTSFIKVLVPAMAFSLTGLAVQAQTIYYDSFSGGATALNGKTTDTGSGTWISTTAGGQTWLQDGTLDGSTTTDSVANALLAFTPTNGNIYELSVTASMSGSTSGWVALGFTESGKVIDEGVNASSFTGNANNPGASPWMLKRSADNATNTNQIVSFLGAGTAGSEVEGTFAGSTDLKIILDTTASAWSAEWFVDGTSVRNISYVTNPTISYVGISLIHNGTGTTPVATIDNFQLSTIPEPHTYGLFFGAAAGMIILVRRSRSGR